MSDREKERIGELLYYWFCRARRSGDRRAMAASSLRLLSFGFNVAELDARWPLLRAEAERREGRGDA